MTFNQKKKIKKRPAFILNRLFEELEQPVLRCGGGGEEEGAREGGKGEQKKRALLFEFSDCASSTYQEVAAGEARCGGHKGSLFVCLSEGSG